LEGKGETKDRAAVCTITTVAPISRRDVTRTPQACQLRISNAKIELGATWYKSHAAARGSVIIRYRFNRVSLFPREIRRRYT